MLSVAAAILMAASSPGNAEAPPSFQSFGRAFVENRGQWDPRARFLARSTSGDFWVTSTGYALDHRQTEGNLVRGHVVKVSFVGSTGAALTEGVGEPRGMNHYYQSGRESLRAGRYDEVRAVSVLPGVDARFTLEAGRPRYDVTVRPGTDPAAVRLAYEGARDLRVLADGRLSYRTSVGEVQERGLTVFQGAGEARRPVSARYVIHGDGTVGFHIGAYDRAQPLTVDPILWTETAATGTGRFTRTDSSARGIVVAGSDSSGEFPATPGAYQTAKNGELDAVVARYDLDGSLLWATYLGGVGNEIARDVALTGSGGAVVVGTTNSADFPRRGNQLPQAPGTGLLEADDAFVTGVSNTGAALTYSSRLGSSGPEDGAGVVLESAAVAYVAGSTASNAFPIKAFDPIQSPVQSNYAGGAFDGFLAKVDLGAQSYVWSTYLGGSARDVVTGVALQAGGPVVVGTTASANLLNAFSSSPGFDPTFNGGTDLFALGVSPQGNTVRFRTFIGGANLDESADVALDPGTGRLGFSGTTESPDYPLVNAFQRLQRDVMAVCTVLAPDGASAVFSTLYGASERNRNTPTTGGDVSFDVTGSPILTGSTFANTLLTSGRGADRTLESGQAGFVARFGLRGRLFYGTFVGDSGTDTFTGITPLGDGTVVVAGGTGVGEDRSGVLRRLSLPVTLVSLEAFPARDDYRIPVEFKLDGLAYNASILTVESDSPLFKVPATVSVSRGEDRKVFSAKLSPLEEDASATVTVTLDGVSRTVNLFQPAVDLTSIVLSPSSVPGGQIFQGTLTPAAADPRAIRPVPVRLVDGDGSPLPESAARIPSVVTIGQNKATATFKVYTRPVAQDVPFRVRGPQGFLSDPYVVRAPRATLVFTPTEVASGGLVRGEILLDGQAPAGGYTATVTQSPSGVLNLPSSLTVVGGNRNLRFAFRAGTVTEPTDVTVTLTYASTTATATVRVVP